MSSSTKITCAKALIVLLTMLIGLHTAGAQPFNAVIQKGHGEVVKSASFTVDGKYLVTVSRDKSAKIWDALSGKEIRTFLGHKHTLNAIAIHQERLATSSADGTAAVWDIKTGEMIWQSSNLGNYATSVAWSPNGKYLAIGGLVDSVHIYHGKALNLYKKIRTNPDNGVGYGVHLRFSGDGQLLAIGEDQRTTKIYSTTDWTLQRAFTPEVGYCGGCGTLSAFSPDDKYLLKLSNGTSFTKYEISTGNKIVAFDREMRDIMSTDFHSSGKYYLAATEDTIYLFNDSDVLLQSISLEGKINDARFHPLENQIVIALGKVTVLVDLTGKEVKRFQGILNTTTTGLDYDLGSYWEHHIAKWVKYKPARFFDNKTLFVGKTGYKGRKWEISSASIAMEYIGHEKGILCFERIDDKTIATGGGDGRIIIWDEMTGKVKKVITAHRQPIFDLQVSHDGQLLASCSWDGVINWWNTQNWDRYKYVYKEGASSYVAAFTKNDAYLVVGLLDKTLQLLEIETGRFVKEFVGHTDIVTSIEVKENEVLTASWDGSIIVWDLYSGLIKTRIKTEHPIFSAQWYEEGIISTGSDRQVSFWSADGMSVQKLKGHQSEINGLEISKDLMVTADVDGITKLWDLSKKQVLFEHIQIGKNDWMVKTPQGYFDATDAAISNIHFVRGMDVYGASQLMDKFYVPDLVEHLFASNKSSSSSMAKVIDQSPPPLLKLSGLVESADQAKLYLKVEDQGGGVTDLKLFHNGKRVSFQSKVQKVRSEDKYKLYTIDFPLIAGLNEFSAVASSSSRLESDRPLVTLFSNRKVPGSTCHILAVGINEYQNKNLNLNYARPDASSFAAQMKAQGQAIYSNVILHQLYDQNASRDGILKKIAELKDQVSINDVFVFYYAGHGSVIDGSFYLVSSGANRLYDNSKIKEYGIEASELQTAMLEIKALKQLVIMDACQSGGSVETLAQRGVPEEKAIAQLSRSSGIHVMAAASSDQYATEFASLGHGLFTYTLLKGLEGAADGAPKDGKVTIYELKSYLDDQVPELSIQYKGTPQYPHTFSRGQDFPIVLIED